jgi:hypothetical protein
LLALCVLAILFRHPEQLAIGWPAALTMVAVAIAMLAIGYWVGGPPQHLRLSLALLCGVRNAAIPLMLLAPYLPQALAPTAVFALISAALSFGFATLWRKGHPTPHGPAITVMPEKRRTTSPSEHEPHK